MVINDYQLYAAYYNIFHRRRITVSKELNVGDIVDGIPQAGLVRGKVKKKITSEIMFKNYTVHASKEEPHYLIESIKTGHLAMHKGSALKKIKN